MIVSIVVANYIDDTTFCAAAEDDDDAPAPQRRRIDAAVEDVARQWGDEQSPVHSSELSSGESSPSWVGPELYRMFLDDPRNARGPSNIYEYGYALQGYAPPLTRAERLMGHGPPLSMDDLYGPRFLMPSSVAYATDDEEAEVPEVD